MSALTPVSTSAYRFTKFPSQYGGLPIDRFEGRPEIDDRSVEEFSLFVRERDKDATDERTQICRNLAMVSFAQCHKITDDALISMRNLILTKKSTFLESLDLMNCKRVTDVGLEALASIDLSKLRDCVLSGCSEITPRAILNFLEKCPKLTSLQLVNCPLITKEDAQQIINTTQNLSVLSISGVSIDLAFMTDLEARHPDLASLELSNCTIEPAAWSKLPVNLEVLNVKGSSKVNIETLVGRCKRLKKNNLPDSTETITDSVATTIVMKSEGSTSRGSISSTSSRGSTISTRGSIKMEAANLNSCVIL